MKYITPVKPGEARGLVGDVYKQIKRDFGALVDPFVVHSVSPRLLAGVWAACRESELVGVVPRDIKETIAVTISKTNHVSFCVDAHIVMLHALKAHGVAHALSHERPDDLPERSRKVFEWSRSTMESGLPYPPFSDQEAAEMIGTAVFFQYMNRVATVLLDETPLPSSRWWLKGFLSRIAGWYFSFAARRPKSPGDSLIFLPEAPLPDDLAWATENASLAGAWARFAQEVEHHGRAALGAQTMQMACDYIHNHCGVANGLCNGSLDSAVEPLHADQRSAGRLVLLTALAPHRVDEKTVRDFAEPRNDPERVLGAISWASFTAARHIGSQLARLCSREGVDQSVPDGLIVSGSA